MKTICALIVAILALVQLAQVEASLSTRLDASYLQFQNFKKTHGKQYASAIHENVRYQIFKQNLKNQAQLNAKESSARFGVNKFSDLHPAEFKAKYLNYRPSFKDSVIEARATRDTAAPAVEAVPSTFDWRAPGGSRPVAVTAVKDQGQCGSCWAFSVAETTESAYILAGNAATNLSPQQIVDCDTNDSGCNGGDPPVAYEYVQSYGLETETAYPYTSGTSGNAGTCAYNKANVVTKISGYTWATPSCANTASCSAQNETLLQQNLYNYGPVSICVDASVWQSYTSGILTSSSGCSNVYNNLDHCVQLTGWGVSGSQQYWSVRNSWASDWGENGYIRLLFGQNTCGVADEATLVEIGSVIG